MAVSAKSVIHYTKSLDFLKGILQNGFRLKYCSECIETYANNPLKVAFPMVSFCDIPLSEVKEHTRSYGNYGIGLSKKWAKENGLNPVFYLNHNSPICKNFDAQIDKIVNREKEKSEEIYDFWANAVLETFAFIKNIEGDIVQGGEQIKNYQFYDEREWRWIPPKEVLRDIPFFLEASNYENDKPKYNKQLEDILLKFKVSDISYIIVDKEDDIIEMIKHLHAIFEESHTIRQLQVLTTKIVSLEDIANDF